eukprot:CAMPEP_0167787220 /NCGR_PEP_ID=MMETSP0111_2-20121227/9278_1 /TAXON_ID=91324 /ORGANISM="Lotharella globosa, Strain CCCM811" /LENGTH=423 /DNA_ID=CAMNT_0007678791 /DNA_START=35 /DNA_END=1306 /DNA_ORIENTATION=-
MTDMDTTATHSVDPRLLEESMKRISALHSAADKLDEKLKLLRMRLPRVASRRLGFLWAHAALKAKKTKPSASPLDYTGASKSTERFSYQAGLVEDEAERLLYRVDAIESHGDDATRRQRKALVLRIKNLMKRAGRLSESKTTQRLRQVKPLYQQQPPQTRMDTEDTAAASSPHTPMTPATPVDNNDEEEQQFSGSDSDGDAEQLEPIPERSEEEGNDNDDEQGRTLQATAMPDRGEGDNDNDPDDDNDDDDNDDEDFLPLEEAKRQADEWSPKFYQNSNHDGTVHLTALLPGVAEDDLSISIDREERKLKVAARSTSHGSFDREFAVSSDFELDQTRAELKNEKLVITLVPSRRRRRRRTGYLHEEADSEDPRLNWWMHGRRPQRKTQFRYPRQPQYHRPRGHYPSSRGGGFGGFFDSPMMAW